MKGVIKVQIGCIKIIQINKLDYNYSIILLSIIFLLLTRWLTSDEVRAVIRKSKFSMNIYNYIPLFNHKIYDSLFPESGTEITDTFIKDAGLRADKLNFSSNYIVIHNIYKLNKTNIKVK